MSIVEAAGLSIAGRVADRVGKELRSAPGTAFCAVAPVPRAFFNVAVLIADRVREHFGEAGTRAAVAAAVVKEAN